EGKRPIHLTHCVRPRMHLDAKPVISRKGSLTGGAKVVTVVIACPLIALTPFSRAPIIAATGTHLVPVYVKVEDVVRVRIEVEPKAFVAGRHSVGPATPVVPGDTRAHSYPVMRRRRCTNEVRVEPHVDF